jgi:uncharacterized protein with ATP-grasp and redox domains
MNIKPGCIPCAVNQAYNTARLATNYEDKQRDIINEFCGLIPDIHRTISPPALSRIIQDIVIKHTGIKDPYKQIKESNFTNTLKFIPYLKTYINASKDPMEEAVRIAIAGNAIDLGANPNYNIELEINKLSSNNIVLNDFCSFKKDIQNAESVLYIADNFEESIFDKLLIEELLPRKIIYAVRSKPILNDISLQDMEKAGMDTLCTVIESGSAMAGIVLSECTEKFKKIFINADLVIAKGQGNFETLEDSEREIYFMFKVKCDVIKDYCGFPVGNSILIKKDSKTKNNFKLDI